jgi:hypothetical protein
VGGGSGEIYCMIEQGRKSKKAFINVSLLFCMKCILGPYTMEGGQRTIPSLLFILVWRSVFGVLVL